MKRIMMIGLGIIWPFLAFAHETGEDHHDPAWIGRQAAFQAAQISMRVEGDRRYITANGLPDHQTGSFPNAGNPHRIEAQNYRFVMDVTPQLQNTPQDMRGYLFGVALNGVPFDPGTAEYWRNDRSSGWRYEALGGGRNLGLDGNNAHVQPSGAYHYHGIPYGLVDDRASRQLVGYAADGFPVIFYAGGQYKPSYRLKTGQRDGGPGGRHDGVYVQDYMFDAAIGDLDACNGRRGSHGYEYVLTDQYPFIPRCFSGLPDASFRKAETGRGARGRRGDGERDRFRRPPPRF